MKRQARQPQTWRLPRLSGRLGLTVAVAVLGLVVLACGGSGQATGGHVKHGVGAGNPAVATRTTGGSAVTSQSGKVVLRLVKGEC